MEGTKAIQITSALLLTCKELFGFDLHEALQEALIEKKLLLLGVESENCIYCKKMHKDIFESNRAMYKINKGYIYRKLVVEKDKLPDFVEVKYFPTHFVIEPKDKQVLDEFVGYVRPRDFVEYLHIIYKQEEPKLRPQF